MNNLREHVEMIIKGLDDGTFAEYEEHPEFQDDIDAVAEIIKDTAEYGEDVLRAYLKFGEDSGASVKVWEIKRNLQNHYRGNHSSPGTFLRQEHEDIASGEKEEFLEEYGNWIDWDGMADSPEGSDYMFIKLDGYFGVYVFRD